MRADKFHGNVFVANLPREFSDEQLAQLFDPFGIVIGALIARDLVTGESKGCGLVNIAPARAAADTVKALNGTTVGGRRIEVRAADPDMAISFRQARSGARPSMSRGPEIVSRPRREVQVEYRPIRRRA